MDEMELFASRAEASVRVEKKARAKQLIEEPTRASLLDETQWVKSRGVALVHADTETLLGNFAEYVHPSGARKLVRETWPIAISAVERVEGSWWLGSERRPEARQEWHNKRPIIMHLHLELLGIHAPAVELMVHISYGGIARCELVTDTLFASEGAEKLVTLPAGINVLEAMNLDAKINLRHEVGLRALRSWT